MTESTQKPQHACQEELNCRYKVGSYCTYREIIRAIFSDTQDKDRWMAHCTVNLADTCDLPCKDLDREG